MIKGILTDIEGTTTSIAFVHEILFPYARACIAEFVVAQAGDARVRESLDEVRRIEDCALTSAQAGMVLQRWIDEDRKATPLKALQGMIWAQGYADGTLKGHVYADTPVYLRRWHQQGKRLYVYSSGSVEAQKLIFGHTDYGDLTPLFSDYFDTRIGGKRETQSYRAIIERIGLPGSQVIFLSDIAEELDAARAAGLHSCQLLRDVRTQAATGHPQAQDFSGIPLD